ncbi:c-type cytochrome biogenesis protein CcmI [Cobetia amphilecti]|uniref:C-type cytochrome biogenesis protein CcmI n=1 Tax=Cobetia amphilecti TaxID=1055104 RepID=A0ABT6UNV6_9GAMM|nr:MULTISPECIES: c-type cytochrome biogenesis protein CcmI [Cobetia]MBR9797841.1 c-type cytochrome biogenesis protein CcmI [Gammaproteobacteria bacterium]MDI5884389.1 c-type cytochrome biogenesis protein CcmI [Cobetia amphilecti]UBU49066.1 c-type cytochrome biogenesis protein CcmI [Cobetia amphilecti]BBO55070.1 c-type cytochrome biogenesis protein CcmI [Cobetia sp. AM6]
MILLWLAIAVLLIPAGWLLLLPLRRARRVHADQQAFEDYDSLGAENVRVYRRRLASLERGHARGELDDTALAEGRVELERSLLEDAESLKRSPLKAASSGRVLVPVLLVAMVAGSLYWYQREGASGDLALAQAIAATPIHDAASFEARIARLRAEAEAQPDNAKVWMALFPLYRDAGRLDEAMQSLEALITLEGRVPALIAQLAQLKFFAAQRTLTDEVQALVDEVLAADPRQPTVLGLLGIEAFDHARYPEAIDYWRKAIAGFENPDAAKALREGIKAARQRMASAGDVDTSVALANSVAPEQGSAADQDSKEGAARLTLKVSLDPALEAQLAAMPVSAEAATLYIVARDGEGKLPPLAVVRTTADKLPLTLTLSDDNAMAPMARLSMAERVTLVARISASGQPTAQPGDLEGKLENVIVTRSADADDEKGTDATQAPLALRIDHRVTQ